MTILTARRRGGEIASAHVPRASKAQVAEAILDAVERLRGERLKCRAMESVYDLYQRGCELLDHGDHQAAIVPLQQSPRPRAGEGLDPRGARAGRCFTRSATRAPPRSSRRSPQSTPTNDYALFCLGRSMQLLGRHREACQPLALACSLRPERADYRLLPRSRAPRRRARAERRYAGAAPMLCSIESFRAGVQTPAAVPRVGARPLFLRKE